jgi:mono/diheme cytochrome c family protein
MKKTIQLSVLLLVALLIIVACGAPAPTATPTPEPTATPLPPPTAAPQPTEPPTALQTAAGESAFNSYCGGCHSTGFAKSSLARYRTAKGLVEFIRAAMPPGNPDVVTDEKRYDIVSYMLSENGFIEADQLVNAETAESIALAEPAPPPGQDQLEAGEKAFGRYCRSCHGGGYAESTIARYRSAERLFSYLRAAMPPGNPGQVSEEGHYDITAYILAELGLLEEGQVVNADTAGSIEFGQ